MTRRGPIGLLPARRATATTMTVPISPAAISLDDLELVLGRFPEDQAGNTLLAQYLWRYNLWTRAQQLRDLARYFQSIGVVDQERLREWAHRSSFKADLRVGLRRGEAHSQAGWGGVGTGFPISGSTRHSLTTHCADPPWIMVLAATSCSGSGRSFTDIVVSPTKTGFDHFDAAFRGARVSQSPLVGTPTRGVRDAFDSYLESARRVRLTTDSPQGRKTGFVTWVALRPPAVHLGGRSDVCRDWFHQFAGRISGVVCPSVVLLRQRLPHVPDARSGACRDCSPSLLRPFFSPGAAVNATRP
jgi:hypothetical protein